MFTQCPDCRKSYPLTKAHLRGKKKYIVCADCKKKFKALGLMTENATGLIAEADAEFIAKEPAKPIEQAQKGKKKRQSAKAKASAKSASKQQPGLTPANESSKPVDAGLAPENSVAIEPAGETVRGKRRRSGQVAKEKVLESKTIATAIRHHIPPSTEKAQASENAGLERLPWETVTKKGLNVNWTAGFVFGVFLFLWQVFYFERDNLSQDMASRPYMVQLCKFLRCNIPKYRNLSELMVLQGSFSPTTPNTMIFKAVINNQGKFPQDLPKIRLTLLDYEDQLFAQRLFEPEEYLPASKQNDRPIDTDESLEASLSIVTPKTPIGSYNFDLLE